MQCKKYIKKHTILNYTMTFCNTIECDQCRGRGRVVVDRCGRRGYLGRWQGRCRVAPPVARHGDGLADEWIYARLGRHHARWNSTDVAHRSAARYRRRRQIRPHLAQHRQRRYERLDHERTVEGEWRLHPQRATAVGCRGSVSARRG